MLRMQVAEENNIRFGYTAGANGSFSARLSLPCGSGAPLTVTGYEVADPSGTFANAVETTCP